MGGTLRRRGRCRTTRPSSTRLQQRWVGHCAGEDDVERRGNDRRCLTVTTNATTTTDAGGRLNSEIIIVVKIQLCNPTLTGINSPK
nr:hypothetical protein Itr_chr13CG20010 [Ipomoea trifida]